MQVCLDGSGSDMAQAGENVQRWLERAVGGLCREHTGNIYMASFFLPRRKRRAVQAAGAFVHMLEGALDVSSTAGGGGCGPGGELDARVAMVRERLDRRYAG